MIIIDKEEFEMVIKSSFESILTYFDITNKHYIDKFITIKYYEGLEKFEELIKLELKYIIEEHYKYLLVLKVLTNSSGIYKVYRCFISTESYNGKSISKEDVLNKIKSTLKNKAFG